MCVGGLFRQPKMPVQQRRDPPPTQKAAEPPADYVAPEKIKDEQGDEEKLSTRKKKAREVQKAKEGVKQFGSVDPKSLPDTPSGGVNTP